MNIFSSSTRRVEKMLNNIWYSFIECVEHINEHEEQIVFKRGPT